MIILVDTSVWADWFNGAANPRTDYLNSLLGQAPLAIGDLIVAEVLQGFADDLEMEAARRGLSKLRQLAIGGTELALQSAGHQRVLRGKGAAVPDGIDCLIASYCIRWNLALLHSDPGFEPFERYLGLKVPDPGTPLVA